jgi:phage-related tail protein
MPEEPASLILELLRQMREELATKDDLESVRAEVSGLRSDVADVKSDMHTLRADVAADILTTRKELSERIVGLRRAVIDYHTSVIGPSGLALAASRPPFTAITRPS